MCFSLDNAKHWLTVFQTIIETLNEHITIDPSKSTGYLKLNNEFSQQTFNSKSTGSLSSDCQSSEDSLDSSSLESSDEISVQKIPVSCS